MDEQIRKGVLRGIILKGLDLEYPNEMSDAALQPMLQGSGYGDITKLEVRRDLEYLGGEGYLEFGRKSRDLWLVKLTSKGVKLLEGRIDEDPGILIAR